jgi:ADP-heptose:LPS heptosyltransferase
MFMRILLIRPCCIGDVVLATPVLQVLRRAYPDAHITWAAGGWSRRAVDYHPALDAVLDTGSAALPVSSLRGFWRFVRQMRGGHYDLCLSLVRSPLMSAAVWLSGIRTRAGLDSAGRGFGYNVRAPVNPSERRHEAEIYLDVARALGLDVSGAVANLPVLDAARREVRSLLDDNGITGRYLVINPAGGDNPGMTMHSKRWSAGNFAQVADALSDMYEAQIVLVAGPDDTPILQRVQQHLQHEPVIFAGSLTFPQIGALAADALLYLGNDTGLTHLAAASGAPTAMILGPSDPARYAPYTPRSIALWKPVDLASGGVAASGAGAGWDWAQQGISADDVLVQIQQFLSNL